MGQAEVHVGEMVEGGIKVMTDWESKHWPMGERLAGGVIMPHSAVVGRVLRSALTRKRSFGERLVEWLSR